MMPLHYGHQDASRWAAFSGDYNPVHFDEAWVKARGGHALSVHGMRALLDVKRFISPPADSAPFLKCTVRLRRPLWRDTAYSLMREASERVVVSVKERAGEKPVCPVSLRRNRAFRATTA